MLGNDFRSHLINRYCAIEMKEYGRIYKTSDEAGQLDNLQRRFAFLREYFKGMTMSAAEFFRLNGKLGGIYVLSLLILLSKCYYELNTVPKREPIAEKAFIPS